VNDNTALQTVPAAPLAPATPAAPAVIPDAATLMQSIIDRAASIPIEQTEHAPVAPVSPIEREPGSIAPQYQPPAAYESENYRAIEAWLIDSMEVDPQGAADLGAAVLNQMPQLIAYNREYVLRVLRLDPETASRQVAERNAREYAVTQTLASETDRLFGEYVAKGVQAGLSPLEAAGLAALAYQSFSRGYWQQGNAWQAAYDKWHSEIGSGYKLGPARDRFRELFNEAWRRAAATHHPHKPGALPSQSQYQGLRGEELMQAMLRDQSAA
jgi:hypothetical protein